MEKAHQVQSNSEPQVDGVWGIAWEEESLPAGVS